MHVQQQFAHAPTLPSIDDVDFNVDELDASILELLGEAVLLPQETARARAAGVMILFSVAAALEQDSEFDKAVAAIELPKDAEQRHFMHRYGLALAQGLREEAGAVQVELQTFLERAARLAALLAPH